MFKSSCSSRPNLKNSFLLFTLLFLCLSGCEQMRDTFGLTRSQPDEFMAQDQASLVIPPSLTLIPPSEHSTSAGQKKNIFQNKAKKLILKSSNASSEKNPSFLEQEIIENASKDEKEKEPSIRALLEQEAKEREAKIEPKLFSGKKSPPTKEILQPSEEPMQRLTKDQEEK